MAGNFEQAYNDSLYYFNKLIIPLMKEKNPDWSVKTLEGDKNEISRLLDVNCGIDFVMWKNEKVVGCSNRIQITDKPYNTFTVRLSRDNGTDTEFKKRLNVSDGDIFIKAGLIMQSYVSNDGQLLSSAIMRISSLWDYINKYPPKINHTSSDQIGQASFYVCDWADIQDKKYKINILK